MSQLGKAFIEVSADLKKFPAELRAELKAAMATALAGLEFNGLEAKAKDAGGKAADALGDTFERRGRERLTRAGERGGRSLLGGLKKIFSRDSGDGRSFLSGISEFFGNAFQSLQGAVSSVGTSLAGAGQGAISGVTGLLGGGGDITGALKVGAFAVLIPVAAGLAGALFQLGAALFALPAAAGVAVAAIAPLMIAFQGFGEAVGAGLSGDTEKYNAALKGLAPSARGVVRELVKLGPQFKAIKQDVQGAFFKPLAGFFTEFGRTLLPVAHRGLTLVAQSLGGMARALGDVFTAPQNIRTFNALFQSTNRIVGTLEPAFANLAQALLNLIQPALPFLERGATAFRNFAATVEGFTQRIGRDGTLQGWLQRAADIGKKLVELFKQVGVFVGTVLNSLGDEGTDTIRGMADAFKDLNKYLKSPEGEEFLHNLGVLVHWAGNAVVFFIASLKASFLALNLTFDLFRIIIAALGAFGGAVWTAIKAVGSFFAMIGGWLATAGRAIGNFFTETIPSWFTKIVSFFASLPSKIMEGLKSLQVTLRDWFLNLLSSWYEGVLFKIGQIIAIFLSLPQLIPAAISVLGEKLSESWDFAFEAVKTTIITHFNEIVALFTALPGLLSSAGSAIWTWASDLWTRVWTTTKDLILSGVNSVIDFFYSIPGRIAALGPKILDAARGIGHKIAQGLSEIGNFATDLGQKVLSALKSGINWVINSINRGIADIDDKLPGTLPRIPTLAKGAVVDSPTLALVGEAGPEVVVPLGDPKRAQQLAEQSGLLSMLRSAGGQTVVNVTAYLDASGVLIPVMRTVVNSTLDQQGDELPYARAA